MTPVAGDATFLRPDGRAKVTGEARYTADLRVAGLSYAMLKYADCAHARVTRLDTSRARALPGVLAVITAEDVPLVRYGNHVSDRTLFAVDVVRFHGEVVAALAAVTADIAAEARDLIQVDYEPLPVVNDLEHALDADSPLVHREWESYSALDTYLRSGNVASYLRLTKGDTDSALASAAHVVRGRYVANPAHAVPIEPRAVLAQWEGQNVTIWSSTQVPYPAQAGVAKTLELPLHRVRVIVPTLGGGFGGKCEFHFEAHVAALARAAQRPVLLELSRREEFVAPDKRREEMVVELETGVTADGVITARRARTLLDNGAYTSDSGYGPDYSALLLVGPYRVPNVDVQSYLVYTNRTPSGSVRAPVAPASCWALEQHIDAVAAVVGLDPVELRRRNLAEQGDEGPAGQIYERTAAVECLDRAVARIGYGADRPANEAIGVACGYFPGEVSPSGASVKINSDGTATIITGAQENGSGAVMGLPLLAAEVLSLPPEDFAIRYQDTDIAPWDLGSCGSQTTINNGRAVIAASEAVRDQLFLLAAEQLEASEADLELVGGYARVNGSPNACISIRKLAEAAHAGELLAASGSAAMVPPPEYRTEGCTGGMGIQALTAPTFFAQAAHVKVDLETGVCRVLAVAAAHEVGRVVNPQGALGQVHGGVVMGIGLALTEGAELADDGRQLNASLLDYKLPTASDAPRIICDLLELGDLTGGFRAKGMGEQPCIPTAGAVGNAIARVIGIHVPYLPMTAPRVWSEVRRRPVALEEASV